VAIVSIKNSISKKFEEVTDREKVVRLCSTKHRYIYIYMFSDMYMLERKRKQIKERRRMQTGIPRTEKRETTADELC